jgi:hypothetical protein
LPSLRRGLSFANVVSVLALFVALGGGAYAAVKLKPDSVGSRQVKDDSIRGIDVSEASLGTVPSAAAAGDAALLDGLDSRQLARSGLAWTELPKAHQSGNPPGRFRCMSSDGVECDRFFSNLDGAGGHAPAAFGRDGFGIVHLQGSIRFNSPDVDPANPGPIFQLPAGHRPADVRVFAVLRDGIDAVRLDVGPDGFVALAGDYLAGQWFSLDGIDFPCAPSGADGCP